MVTVSLPPKMTLSSGELITSSIIMSIKSTISCYSSRLRGSLKNKLAILSADAIRDYNIAGVGRLTFGAESEGLDIVKVVILVDRQEGGIKNIRKHVNDVSSIITRDELIRHTESKSKK